jgi:hypothetical protein
MWNEHGEHDGALVTWALCIAAFGVIAVAIGG